jgi:hypothetical protein
MQRADEATLPVRIGLAGISNRCYRMEPSPVDRSLCTALYDLSCLR